MNRLHPQSRHRPADTPSGCFSGLLHCLLCGQTLTATRSSTSSLAPPHPSTCASTRFVDLLLDRDPVVRIDDKPDRPDHQPQLPIVARLMGLDTPADMSWVPKGGSFGRSRSVNSVDYLLRFSPEKSSSLHRRVKTSLSFREVPVGEDNRHFLILRLENSKPGKNSSPKLHNPTEAKTLKNEERIGKGGKLGARVRASNMKSKNPEHSDGQVKMTTLRRGNVKDSSSRSPAGSDWKQKSDYYYYYYYYRKQQAKKSQSTRSKATCHKEVKLSSKSRPKQPEEVNLRNTARPKTSVSDQWGVTQWSRPRSRKASSAAESGASRPQRDERRSSSRKLSKVEDQSSETYGEMTMMKQKIKWLVEHDLKMKRWNCWNKEGVFLGRDYLSLGMEMGILDELVSQIVHDLV